MFAIVSCEPVRRVTGLVGVACCVALVALSAGVALSGKDPKPVPGVIAEESDDALRARVAKLRGDVSDTTAASDEGASILLEEFRIDARGTGHRVARNRIVLVEGAAGEEISTQTLNVSREVKIEAAKGWVLRTDGAVERLGEADVRVVKPQEQGQPVSVIVAFPRVEAGDVLGWSLATSSDDILYQRRMVMSDRFPVKLARVYFQSDGQVAYRMLMRNAVKGSYSSKVLAEQHGSPSEVEFLFHNVRPRHNDPYPAPPMISEPLLHVMYRGWWFEELGRWIYNDSWNLVAVQAADLLLEQTKQDDAIRATAQRVTQGLVDELSRADALFRFVRDEVLDVSGGELDDRLQAASRVLEDRAGDPWEKGFLLSALMRASGIDHKVLWAHSRDFGKFDEGYPALWTFSHMLVALGGAGDRLYDPTCHSCAPGELAPQLRGARAFSFVTGTAAAYEQLRRDVLYRDRRSELVFQEYKDAVAAASWHRLQDLPGDPSALLGTIEELAEVDPVSGAVELGLTATGFNDVRDLARAEPDPLECMKRYVADRFAEHAVLEAFAVPADSGGQAAGTALHGRLEGMPPPPAGGPSWVVPPQVAFGSPMLAAWNGPKRGPYHVGYAQRVRRVTVLPLPEGWGGIAPVRPTVVECPAFRYESSVAARDGKIVIERALSLRATTIDLERLPALDYSIRRIHEFERAPLMLQDAPSGPTSNGR